MIDITLNGESKDEIVHHLAEDVAIALAQSIDKALGDRTKITRFGYALIPMDEALAYVSRNTQRRSRTLCKIIGAEPKCLHSYGS
jgi:imidazoleglycerol-phosphate dehydratase